MIHPMTRTRGGILAALLTLYDRDSDMASVSDTTTEPYSAGTRTPDGGPRDSGTHSLLDLASASGRRLATASRALHLPESRPRRERNAAGVWGPLIASTTGALVGAAAPAHSTIAPDVKRSGYHVSRWVYRLLFCNFSPKLRLFEGTHWTATFPTLQLPPLHEDRGACYLNQAHNTTRPPRLREQPLPPICTGTLPRPILHHPMLIMQDGWRTCVIYPSCIGLHMLAIPRVERTRRQKAKALMRRVALAQIQRPKHDVM